MIRPAASRAGDEIRTARLRLRRARMDDIEAMHAILSDPRAMPYWDRPPHAEIAQTAAFLAWMVSADRARNDDWIVEEAGRVIGKCGCWAVPEVGLIFHPDVWGRGIASEALGAAVANAFATYPVPALTADVDPRNIACLRVLGRLGFRETHRAQRTLQVGGVWCDSVYLALPRPPAAR